MVSSTSSGRSRIGHVDFAMLQDAGVGWEAHRGLDIKYFVRDILCATDIVDLVSANFAILDGSGRYGRWLRQTLIAQFPVRKRELHS